MNIEENKTHVPSMKSYRRGCKCVECRGINSKVQREYQARVREKIKNISEAIKNAEPVEAINE